ncbi:MAG: DUF499 domain-containing protein [Gammaproteobacteria bacterium]|nr:DUF499 domain-containing protein [Gammaproteobacteria bacterium]
MAKSARQTVFEGMELLPEALASFVEQRLDSSIKGHWQVQVSEKFKLTINSSGKISWDQQALLKCMMVYWKDSFGTILGHSERSYVSELLEVRNKLSHNMKFSYDDAERALDSMRRLLQAVSAGDTAEDVGKMRDTILRTKFAELQRNEERKNTRELDLSVDIAAGLLPWREVVEPHPDVATGEFQQAEFAADLAKVHNGSAPSEYLNPGEFFSRTYLTNGLSTLLLSAAKRLSGQNVDPVVELQTNFGGGKTHSMLALYHMTGGTPAEDLPGLDQFFSENNISLPELTNRAVLVGTSRGPQDVLTIENGTRISTTWGELAWQLGGAKTYSMVAEHDEKGIAPGSNLLEDIFNLCSPCIILIDEWVAYLRQIYRTEGLPSGSFDANLSFVQSLTEAVKASPSTLLVASLPASQIEVGGEGGQEALNRLKQTFSRVESSWLPASQEESYEIVRRRLFKDIPGDKFMHRDNTLKQFAKMYRESANDFPQGCADEVYRRKLEKAYPIHPDLFDQLFTSWGSLEKFQRTRGVLRLMAQVIHGLWINNDPSVMIMPGCVAAGTDRVESELLHYLDVNWQSIIAADIDGSGSIPLKIDRASPNIGKYSAARRIARTIFMATAPMEGHENRGIDDKHINLGIVQPGERPAIFGDALRRLSNQAKFLHGERGRYWYSTSPSLNRIAADRASQMEESLVLIEIDKVLIQYATNVGDWGHFDSIQVAPGDSSEIPDEAGGIRAVVLGVDHPHNGKKGSEAATEAFNILSQRGNAPRVYRNTLIFIAAESRQIDSLKDAMRNYLAWEEIHKDAKSGVLDLKASEVALAEEKTRETRNTTKMRIKEAWCYVLYPWQEDAKSDLDWQTNKIPAQDGLFTRTSRKLVNDEALFPELGPARLNRELEKYVWHEDHHLLLNDIWEYFNRHVYFPRLRNKDVLIKTVSGAISGLVPGPFAYAERWNEADAIFDGLAIREATSIPVVINSESIIIKPDIAEIAFKRQNKSDPIDPKPDDDEEEVDPPVPPSLPTRFQGAVMISPDRPAKEFPQVVEGIIEQLTTLPGAKVEIKLEIDAEAPDGFDKSKVRVLTENAKTLGFFDKDIS